ncbi:endonuclease/exonuclease/phosphatase family protein [Aliiroseovarius sp. CAU 1755]
MIKRGLKILLVVLLFAVGVGYLGHHHPAGDSFAVFRPQLAAGLLALGVLLWLVSARKLAVFAIAVATLALGPILRMNGVLNAASEMDLSVYQKNMRFRVEDPKLLGDDVMKRRPDFLTLQEVSGANMALFDTLGATYGARQFCPFATVGGVGVASRWPIVEGSGFCAEADGLAAMQVTTPKGPVWVVSIHLHWPWPYSQPAHLARLLPRLAKMSGPMVIGGDFNMVPWSDALRNVAMASNTMRIGPPHVTLTKLKGWMRVPIDHIFVSEGEGIVQRLPRLGSDHYGLFARFALPFN